MSIIIIAIAFTSKLKYSCLGVSMFKMCSVCCDFLSVPPNSVYSDYPQEL